MPTIPTIQPDVQVSEGSGYRFNMPQSPDMYGSNVGTALQGLGEQASQAAIDAQAKLNQISVSNAMSSATNNLLSSQTAQLQKHGINVLGSPATKTNPEVLSAGDQFANDADKTYKDTMDGFTNNVQKQQFEQWYNSQYPTMLNKVLEHQGQQIQIAQKDSNESQMQMNSQLFKSSILNNDMNTASTAIRNGLSMSQQMGVLMGIPSDAQAEQDNQYFYKTMADTVGELIKDNRFQDAAKVVYYYKNHLSGDQADTSNSAITKSYAPVLSRQIAIKAMQDNGNDVLRAKQSIPIDSPNYEMVTKDIASIGSDLQVEQAKIKKQQEIEMNQKILRLGSVEEATNFTQQMVSAGLMTAATAEAVIERQKKLAKASLDPKTNWAVNYETKPITSSGQTGLERDTALAKEYTSRLSDPADVISTADQNKYDKAASNLNTYWGISSGGSYNQQDQQETTDNWTQAYNATFKAAEMLAQKGKTKDEIIAAATPTLNKLGMNVDDWTNQVEWSGIGL